MAGQRHTVQPRSDAQQVNRRGCEDVLEVSFGEPAVAGAAQAAAPYGLSMRALDAGTRCVCVLEGVTTPNVKNRTLRIWCANLLPFRKQWQQPFAT